MPCCQSVSPLSEAAGERVRQWLLCCLCHQPGPQERQAVRRHVLTALAPRPRQDLLSHVLASPEVVMDNKCQLVEILGDVTTRSVDLIPGGPLFVEEVFHLYRSLTMAAVINLTRLGIVCDVRSIADRRYVPDINVTFYRLMGHMRHLVWVTLAGVADGTILAHLGANCHALEYLDVSGSPRVDDVGVAKLLLQGRMNLRDLHHLAHAPLPPTSPCCATLTYLGVTRTETSSASIVLLLRCLRQVTSLGGFVNDGSLLEVLKLLKNGKAAEWPTSLSEVSEARILPHQVPLLVAACPGLTTLVTEETSVPALSLLPSLQSLTVDLQLRGESGPLYDMVEVRGSALTHLRLENSINCPLELTYLMDAAPHLHHLEARLYLGEGCVVTGWASLASAKIGVTTCKGVVALLTHTPALRRLTLSLDPEPYTETWRDLNDAVLEQVVGGGGLGAVEELVVTDCGATVTGLQLLMLHCQHLALVASLINWPAITLADLHLLREQIACNNWCLDLQLRLAAPLKPLF
ncbi:uncharacterized protein LOC127001792 [Eriocheir sinensis]|uniref:uncharacterized protein LOC127001792 n=1 Tax=Eriocheir sinensis TaxID=95602 RepID=UPI0021C9B98A|nr:uncharacterized protein LOC127001792 [Eriocheir sinensis]